jgi:hypothetical protein
MIRPILTELVLFLTPFGLYALFLIVTRTRVLDTASWPAKRVMILTGVALVLVLGSFLLLAHLSGAPPGSRYLPARIEDGKFVPGEIR